MAAVTSLIGIIKSAFYIIVGLCGIGFLIGFHELGHFLFCKLFGIRTPSFSIGMGPRLISKKMWDTEFSLSLLPIGGYVEIAGAREVGQGDQKEAERNDEQSFARKPYYQQLLVLLGGILFNLMFAYVTVSAIFYFGPPKIGLLYPKFASTKIEKVAKESSAAQAQLQPGDVITAFDGQSIQGNPLKLLKDIKGNPGKKAVLGINRQGKKLKIAVTIGQREIPEKIEARAKGKKIGQLGIDFVMPERSLVESIKTGVTAVNGWIMEIFHSLGTLFTKRDFKQMGGPLMIATITIKSAAAGLGIFLLLLSFISVNLAVLNVFPLPIFDGGQILFYTIEAIIGRPLPSKVREYIHIACWLLLLVLLVFMSIQDIIRLVSPVFK